MSRSESFAEEASDSFSSYYRGYVDVEQRTPGTYRQVQLDFTPEVEVFYMLFDRCHTKNVKRFLKQHIKYFNFRSKIQLDQPV